MCGRVVYPPHFGKIVCGLRQSGDGGAPRESRWFAGPDETEPNNETAPAPDGVRGLVVSGCLPAPVEPGPARPALVFEGSVRTMDRPTLTSRQRLEVARLSGLMSRLTRGRLRGLDDDVRQDLLAEVSTDPAVLGVVLGALLVPEQPEWVEADADGAALVRASGADEQVAEAEAAWQRERHERRSNAGWITL